MKPSELLTKHLSDKTSHHNYAEFYDEILGSLTNVTSVLEIGIMHGQSMKAWEELWPEAQIVGIDNDATRQFNKGRIKSYHADTTDRNRFLELAMSLPQFDVIIDDGSHVPVEQLWAFGCLWENLKPQGVYIIEDIPHAKYKRVFEAIGVEWYDLRRPGGCQDDLVAVWR